MPTSRARLHRGRPPEAEDQGARLIDLEALDATSAAGWGEQSVATVTA